MGYELTYHLGYFFHFISSEACAAQHSIRHYGECTADFVCSMQQKIGIQHNRTKVLLTL